MNPVQSAFIFAFLQSAQPPTTADTTEWELSRRLVARIQAATPSFSDSTRNRYLQAYAEMSGVRESIADAKRDLVRRLTVDRTTLRALTDSSALHDSSRAAWQDSLLAHNARCRRTFTDPADVQRCDTASERLAEQRAALDLWYERLDERGRMLRNRQQDHRLRGAELADRDRALTKRLTEEFVQPLQRVLAQRAGATTLRLSGKSFIRQIDLSSLSAGGRRHQEFARLANLNFSENPSTASPNTRDYRLWSQANIVAACREDTLVWWKMSQLAHRGGTEMRVLDAQTSVLEPPRAQPNPSTGAATSLQVTFAIKGKPNDAALPAFRVVRPRNCDSIWHRVWGTVTCKAGKASLDASISGSAFPSHRVWTDTRSRSTVEQGPFSNLWECDATSPDLVR